jgi:hypothetical protein
MVAKNRMVGLTEPAIGHHDGDLDHSSVRYRTIEANERPFLPVSIFAISSSQPIGLLSERLADHAQPGDLRPAGSRDVGTGLPSVELRPLTRRGGMDSEHDVEPAVVPR